MTIPFWQALVFCAGAVAGWFVHTGYMVLKEEDKLGQEWLDGHEKAEMLAKETVKKIMEGRI